MPKDIRTLCSQHAKEMIYAKYALIRTNKQEKETCDTGRSVADEREPADSAQL